MTVFTGPEKGQKVVLDLSPEGKSRIVIGLSWDPLDAGWFDPANRKTPDWAVDESDTPQEKSVREKAYMISEIIPSVLFAFHTLGRNKAQDNPEGREDGYNHFDLDLYCHIYDSDGNHKAQIGPEAEIMIDASKTLYHSGEDYSGIGGPDDEQIHIETRDLPDGYDNFIITVTSDNRFSFDEVDDPFIRIADSKTENDQLKMSIKPPANLDAYAFVFARIFKENDQWYVQNISEFVDFEQDWPEFLKRYL